MIYHDKKRLVKKKPIRGLNDITFDKNMICVECMIGKQQKRSHKKSTQNSITNSLELIHVGLEGPIETASLI